MMGLKSMLTTSKAPFSQVQPEDQLKVVVQVAIGGEQQQHLQSDHLEQLDNNQQDLLDSSKEYATLTTTNCICEYIG